jgi:hypothetical protein
MKRRKNKMRHTLKISISIIFVFLISGYSMSQDKPVILSEKVGEIVDLQESEKYNLFGKYQNFKSASYYRNSEGKYYVKISYQISEKSTKDTIIVLSEKKVFNTALRFEFYEDIVEGIYPKNPKFSLDTLDNKYFVMISNVYKDILPFVDPKQKLIPNRSSSLGVSFSYVPLDLSSVKSFFDEAENSFRRDGWNIPKNNLNFNVSAMYSFNLYIRIYKTLGLEFETGKSIGPNVEFWSSAGFVRYGFDFEKLPGIRPFVSAGIGKQSYYVEATYNNAIVDSSGAYLDKIWSGGGKVGYFLKTGFEAWLPTKSGYFPICLNAFAIYSYIPEITSTSYGYTTKVKLGGFRFGAGLRIYL